MAKKYMQERGISGMIFGSERGRRIAAVDYERALVGLDGFSPIAADKEDARRFSDEDIDLDGFARPRSA